MVEFRDAQAGKIKLLEVWGTDLSGREIYMGNISHSGNYCPSSMMAIQLSPEDLQRIANRCLIMKSMGA